MNGGGTAVPLVRVLIPVVPAHGEEEAVLREYRFRTVAGDRGEAVQPFFSDEAQKAVFRGVALTLKALEADRPLGAVPERFGACVEVTVREQLRAMGTSSMLGAAAGFVAARAVDPAELRPLVVTGALAWPSAPSDAGGRIGERVGVRPVAGVARKLRAVLAVPRRAGGILVVLPEAAHQDDDADAREIEETIAVLEARDDTVLRVSRLDQVLAAWAPAKAWVTPELAADYAGIEVPLRRGWRTPKLWIAAGGATTAVLVPLLWFWPQPKTSDPGDAVAVRIFATPDARCDPDAPLIDPGRPGSQQAAAAACRALAACDAEAGYTLDPDRRARGLPGGIGPDFLAQPSRSAAARGACEAAVNLAPNSSKAPWHLSRVLEAQGEAAAAARLRERAVQGGDLMARLRLAQDLLVNGEAATAREQFRLLAERAEPVPEAAYWQAWLIACGIGGPRDGPASAALGRRLLNLARAYPGVPDFLDRARGLAAAAAAASTGTAPPVWCNNMSRP